MTLIVAPDGPDGGVKFHTQLAFSATLVNSFIYKSILLNLSLSHNLKDGHFKWIGKFSKAKFHLYTLCIFLLVCKFISLT